MHKNTWNECVDRQRTFLSQVILLP